MPQAAIRLHSSNLQSGFCPTFTPLPFDGSLTVPEAFDHHAKHSPDHPLFVFADNATTNQTVTYSEAWRMLKRAAKIVEGHYKRFEVRYIAQESIRPSDQGPTIGILASADSISYFMALVGTMRLGFVPFPISIRNSPLAVAHLIKSSHVFQLLVSPDPAMQRLSADAVTILEQDGISVEVLPMIQFDDISDRNNVDVDLNCRFGKLNMDNIVCVFHSSGSTAFPKVIPMSNRTVLQLSSIPLHGERNLCRSILAMHMLPTYHIMGTVGVLFSATAGLIAAVFKPSSSPPTTPTPERYLEDALKTKSDILFTVPSFIEAWFQYPALVESLTAFSLIVYSGAPLNRRIGEQLVSMGIAVSSGYGTTETGGISMFAQEGTPTIDEWEYFKLSSHLSIEMLPQDGMDDLFEPVVVQTPFYKPNVINTVSSDGRPAYRTNDLLQRHPRNPSLWKIYGRADDQIMLSNGEKTNPVPLEAILVRDPHIAAAVMFGRGRFQNGVLIEPEKEFAFDPVDEQRLGEFRNKIWGTVERLNQYAPTHSRLFKEMILVSSPSKPFEYTMKGTPRRSVAIAAYKQEIDALYQSVEESSQTDIEPPSSWTEIETLPFIQAVVHRVMQRSIKDDIDLFGEGCDSLQATSIRNSILHALRKSMGIPMHGVANNFVYDHPTISSLCLFVSKLSSHRHDQEPNEVAERSCAMQEMMEKYSTGFRSRPSELPATPTLLSTPEEVVLLTGTTGRLGCHLLAQLLARSTVTKVYALNRSGESAVAERQGVAFEKWQLDVSLLSSPKLTMLEGDIAKPGFGLAPDVLHELKDSVTSIIHNAWRLDFNLSLTSFEPLVSSVRNIVDLSLESSRHISPPILFISSIAVLPEEDSTLADETPITDPSISVGSGYGESKWVAENILLRAMRDTGVRVNIVRLTQLCGDRAFGRWSEKEWVGAMMRGSQIHGSLPTRDELISWVPVDVAAAALLEMLGCNHPVLHLAHPKPTKWSIVSDAASAILQVPSVSYADWVAKLQHAHRSSSSSESLMTNPALKLVDFFSNLQTARRLDTRYATDVSHSLRTAKRLTKEDVERWITYWQSAGFLST
ncbi:acetyl-CoA synthetase-like protein [Artomyces pyxidatus]|uniref:Acetyl-CoA synthetase-like protein n=1 Tax=Artomyces pyxidatus TaxID=48021 RepID=A0ACB8SW93_9AGAM|nr:acetyl-CoA synthetase-like protein [Artomyces pyxidatus]